ncbi:MAG: type IV pilus secretin family protein, partial [Gammaproteobacteria bacterium]
MRSLKAVVSLFWIACIQAAWAQEIPRVSLEGIFATPLPGDRVRIELRFSHPPSKPRVFTLKEPPRIVLDFPHVVNRLPRTTQKVNMGMADKVSAVEAMGRTRVVVSLIRSVPYDIKIRGHRLWITLEAAPGAVAGVHRIENVDFRRRRGDVGEVIVTFEGAAPPADLRQEGEVIVAEFARTELPKRLERRLDVEDFATPVRWVDVFKKNGRVRIEVYPEGLYEYFAYQSGDRFVLAVRPLTPEEKAARKKKYTGEKLSLNFQNVDVRAVLAILADFTGINIVASDSVQGTITLRLQEVPWDQALDLILQAKGLGKRQEGNVIWVAPLSEIAAFEQAKKRALEETRKALPLRTELIQINYARASEMADLLKAKLLSERGSVVVDQRTNTLLVQETAPKLAEIR